MAHFNSNIPGYSPLISKLRNMSDRTRNNIGGRVGIWVDDSYESEVLDNLSIFKDKFFESVLIKIKIGKNKFKIIGNIYKPPGNDISRFNDNLNEILLLISNDQNLCKASEIQLLDDFNINLLNRNNHTGTSEFLDILLSNGLLPLITLPSCSTPTSSTLVDNIFSNSKEKFSDSGLIYSCLSDYWPVFHISPIIKDKKSSRIQKHCRDNFKHNL